MIVKAQTEVIVGSASQQVPDHAQGFLYQKPINMNLMESAALHIESGLGGKCAVSIWKKI